MSMQARNRKKCVFTLPKDFKKKEEDPDNNNPDRQRMRKKTPHHLINKRIHITLEDKEKVASILALSSQKQEETSKESTQQECLSKAK